MLAKLLGELSLSTALGALDKSCLKKELMDFILAISGRVEQF